MSFENLIPEALESKIGAKLFTLWFGSKVQFELHGSKLYVYSPTIFLCEWIRKNFSRSITSAVLDVTGKSLQTEYLVRSTETITASPATSASDRKDQRKPGTGKVRPSTASQTRQNKLEFPTENIAGINNENPAAELFAPKNSRSSSNRLEKGKISGKNKNSQNRPADNQAGTDQSDLGVFSAPSSYTNQFAVNDSFSANQASVDQFAADQFAVESYPVRMSRPAQNLSVNNNIAEDRTDDLSDPTYDDNVSPRLRKSRHQNGTPAENRKTGKKAGAATNSFDRENNTCNGKTETYGEETISFENKLPLQETTSPFESRSNDFIGSKENGRKGADSSKRAAKGISSSSEVAKNRERKKDISKEAPLPELITRDGYNIAIIHSAPKPVPVSSRDFASYDSFVVGKSNRLARSAADFAVDNPGKISPIFICGSTSVGKTHLLEGVCSKLRAEIPKKQALFLTAGEFTSLFVQSLKTDAKYFQNKFRNLSVLAIDDIHFLQGRKATQLALLSLIDMLKAQGVQMLFSADVPLKEMKDMRSEIISRIESGLVCEIDAPERDTLLTIFRHMAAERGLAIPEDVCRFVVSNFSTHARQLSGVLNRLHAAYLSTGQSLTLDTARDVLSDLLKGNRRAVSLQDIERVIIELFGISTASLRSKSRAKVTCFPRMMAMWLARKYTNAALSEIGQYFGNRSHSTVLSAQKRIDHWLNDNLPFELQNKTWYIADTLSRLENALTH